MSLAKFKRKLEQNRWRWYRRDDVKRTGTNGWNNEGQKLANMTGVSLTQFPQQNIGFDTGLKFYTPTRRGDENLKLKIYHPKSK